MIDLEAIKARLSAATPGPWRRDGNHRAKVRGGDGDTLTRVVPESSDEPWSPTDEANADLIAHAPGDIAALIAEVERLREVNDGYLLEMGRQHALLREQKRGENAERAAVVAWLREQANSTTADVLRARDLDAADLIERGEHREEKE
jgi:flavin-dependent dehydrogenase